ncbi:hypothetical protein [Streptococcus danieliae]|uniref:hypothetical protein n=1 Tax=Streptococcus danieliae TaxID=747656 RepID=UPI0021C9AC9C|nr:hypothetical protein [Streptococcus danieliae]MCU0082076.1 hypothetical protein [Streptococcus danieliae]
MKIKDIFQAPFGTVISLDENVPSDGVVGKLLTVDEVVFHKVKGTPSNIWTEVLIDKTDDFSVGQTVKFVNIN